MRLMLMFWFIPLIHPKINDPNKEELINWMLFFALVAYAILTDCFTAKTKDKNNVKICLLLHVIHNIRFASSPRIAFKWSCNVECTSRWLSCCQCCCTKCKNESRYKGFHIEREREGDKGMGWRNVQAPIKAKIHPSFIYVLKREMIDIHCSAFSLTLSRLSYFPSIPWIRHTDICGALQYWQHSSRLHAIVTTIYMTSEL